MTREGRRGDWRHVRRRKPTPRTASIQPGSPSFLRSAATCTSIVFGEPYQRVSHTSSKIRLRLSAAPGSEAKQGKEVELTRRERERLPVERGTTRAPVDLEPAHPQRPVHRRARLQAPHHGANPCNQLAKSVRLDEVVVGAELETDHPVDLLTARGDDDDRHPRALAQSAAHLEPVDIRQAKVEQDEIRLGGVERLLTRGDTIDLEALPPQTFGERLGDRILVLYDEHLHARIVAPPHRKDIGAFPNLYRMPAKPALSAVPSLTGHRLRSEQSIEGSQW